MIKFIFCGLIIWVLALISYELVRYNYNKKVRPHANEFLYKVEAFCNLFKLRIQVEAKKIKKRNNHPITVVEPSHKPRCWEWSTNYRTDNNITTYSTELITNEQSTNT